MQLPLISIITPSLNQGQFIEETILSVKNQEYPSLEHIVIDGGSTDNTIEILTRYQSTYNLRWISEPDDGMYQGINKGLRMARGELLSYLNTDDLFFPWTLNLVVRYFDAHPEVDIAYGDLLMDVSGRLHLEFAPPFRLKLYLRTGWSLPQPTVFWRRRVYEEVGGFNEGLRFVGDWDYWVRAACGGFRFKKIHEFLAVARIHPASKTVASNVTMRKEIEQSILHYADGQAVTKPKRLLERFYLFSWHRLYMAMFLASYALKKVGKAPFAWKHFVSLDHLSLGPWHELLVGFLPFGRRGTHRWIIRGCLRKVVQLAESEYPKCL